MAFALFYEPADLSAIADQLRRADLSDLMKVTAQAVWDQGFRHYERVPYATYARQEGDASIHELVIDGSVKKADMQALLRAIAQQFGSTDEAAQYMDAIADDMNTSAVEPWSGGGSN